MATKAELEALVGKLRKELSATLKRLNTLHSKQATDGPIVRIALSDAVRIFRGAKPGGARDVIAAALDRDHPDWRREWL